MKRAILSALTAHAFADARALHKSAASALTTNSPMAGATTKFNGTAKLARLRRLGFAVSAELILFAHEMVINVTATIVTEIGPLARKETVEYERLAVGLNFQNDEMATFLKGQ